MPRPSLTPQIAARILEHVREQGFPRGQHLAAQTLADTFRVSRAPVAAALGQLEALGVVRSETNRGYFLEMSALELAGLSLELPQPVEAEDERYFAIAGDRLDGRLPERVSENELMRLYGMKRSAVVKVLHRIAEEGWIERLPGNGWAFRPVLTSREAYEQGYLFRAAIETEALLVPTFLIDPEVARRLRAEQQDLLDGGHARMSRDHIFQLNASFHETLVGFSGNEFFVDAVKRVNRLRRLAEYKITVDRSRLPNQAREHLRILDLIEAGAMTEASQFLRRHILGANAVKAPQLDRTA